MITRLIHWSIDNRPLVLLAALVLCVAGVVSLKTTPLDAIPDLSDVQVIVKTRYPGQSPRVVEDQVTYPLATALMAVPGAVNVRGYSMFGDSFVYVIFEDGTDLYWARSRVLEYLNQVRDKLPDDASTALGPDATGVGWVYEYALVDRTGQHDLSQLRSLQDWFLRFELQGLPGVSEVATVGGMVRQYQVVVDPQALRAYGLPLDRVKMAISRGNQESGASVIEMGEAEYMVRVSGYLTSVEDLEQVPVMVSADGTPVLVKHVAQVRLGPQMRRGIADLDGEGEVVGGIVVMRYGENALATIEHVKARLDELRGSLPDGVEIIETYDRSSLIERAVSTLQGKLLEEFLVVALVCILFLFHIRSSLVILISLPIGVLVAFVIMRTQGINANIMSLGGIAIAIGAMVDGAIVMVENMHKHLEGRELNSSERWKVVAQASAEVGPAIFYSLVIITLSFLPVFTLQAQEGRLFAPLAFTKTYAMAASAGLAVTLVPVLMGYLVRGKIRPEMDNPVNRLLVAIYRPMVRFVLRFPWLAVATGALVLVVTLYPVSRLGTEFMPDLDEGDLLYMPTTYPGLSAGKAQQLLQQTDRLIRTVPEVTRVFGKVGRAETATDPAPMTMIETTIQLKPRDQWRPGMDLEGLKKELNEKIRFPGLTNAWVMPIKTRIDMLATGIKTPVGVKIAGADLGVIESIGKQVERVLKPVPGTVSVYADRSAGGRYIQVDIDRTAAARFGLNIADLQEIMRTAVGGMDISETVEGLERYPVNLRYPIDYRDSPEALRLLPIVTAGGATLALGEVAKISVVDGPPMIKSENARPNGWVFVDIQGVDLGSYVAGAKKVVADQVELPPGYSITWAGQFQYMERANERLRLVVPVTLVIIILMLYLNFRRFREVGMILVTLPMGLVGGVWLLYLLNYNLSVAVGVGFIALAGVGVEMGVVLLVYLNQALSRRQDLAMR
ncbi:MAG: CusA/CzcA family heavy metal efflux RND transporter, partial [Chromatiales bacterium]|nr:CusA/CzcA family heavy metal efflux RND transporter [Chromatiales bacterium]